MPVDTQIETVKFLSPRYPQMHMVRESKYSVQENGYQRLVREGVSYDFEDGVLELRSGQDVLPDGPHGEDRDAIEWLRSHRDFGTLITEVIIPTPTEQDFLASLTSATIALDDESVRVLLETERESWKRGNLIEAAENALTQIEAAQAGRE